MTVHRRGRRLAALASAVLLAGVWGCAGSSLSDDTSHAAGPVKIGLVVSLSGTYQAVGEDMKRGWDLYLNLHGNKLGGRDVEVIVVDEGDGSGAVVAPINKLVKQDKVVAVAGIVGGGS